MAVYRRSLRKRSEFFATTLFALALYSASEYGRRGWQSSRPRSQSGLAKI